MNQRFGQLYESLLKDIDACRQKYTCLQKQIEQSFLFCNQYLAIVRRELISYIFQTAADEIYFFKCLKPLFAAELEYYSLYYHAQLFKNEVYDPVKIKQFWNREASRLEKFTCGQREFYEYYKSGYTDKDIQLFTRINLTPSAENEQEAMGVQVMTRWYQRCLHWKDIMDTCKRNWTKRLAEKGINSHKILKKN